MLIDVARIGYSVAIFEMGELLVDVSVPTLRSVSPRIGTMGALMIARVSSLVRIVGTVGVGSVVANESPSLGRITLLDDVESSSAAVWQIVVKIITEVINTDDLLNRFIWPIWMYSGEDKLLSRSLI